MIEHIPRVPVRRLINRYQAMIDELKLDQRSYFVGAGINFCFAGMFFMAGAALIHWLERIDFIIAVLVWAVSAGSIMCYKGSGDILNAFTAHRRIKRVKTVLADIKRWNEKPLE